MTSSKPKRQRKPREGDVLAIPLGDGTYGFSQVCAGGDYAYFDLRSSTFPSIDEIVVSPVAFRVPTVTSSVMKAGWVMLGNVPPKGLLKEVSSYRNQPVGSNQVYIIKGNQVRLAAYDEAKDLEAMSVWFEQHVVQRLVDHFDGRPNAEFESTRKNKCYDPTTKQELDPETGEVIQRGPKNPTLAGEGGMPASPVKSSRITAATFAKLNGLVGVYDLLIPLLRGMEDKRVVSYVESVANAISQLRVMISDGGDAKTGREMLKGLRQGLHETPRILCSLMPDTGTQLVGELERQLGGRFKDF